jgi:hypothetical protein
MFKRRRLSRLSALGADTASQRRAATESVFCLLPDVDPVWLATAFDAYPSSKPADAASHIVDKLLDMRGGHPSVARAPSGKGKGRAADSEDWDEQLATINRDLCVVRIPLSGRADDCAERSYPTWPPTSSSASCATS